MTLVPITSIIIYLNHLKTVRDREMNNSISNCLEHNLSCLLLFTSKRKIKIPGKQAGDQE